MEHSHSHCKTFEHQASIDLNEQLRAIEVKHESFHHQHDAQKELEALATFRNSLAFSRCVSFLLDMCEAVRGHTITTLDHGARVQHLLDTFAAIEVVVDTVEPVATVTRFGNPAFKTLMSQLQTQRARLLYILIGSEDQLHDELLNYLLSSLGDAVRVDYGTGHELNFLAFLSGCLHLRLIEHADLPAVGLIVLSRYFRLVRMLQTKYHLEPAGSRGCWGLDDYQFLPFLVGASQLSGHPRLRPKSVLDRDVRETFAADYMYLAAIVHVHHLKVASFAEHSPMLNDITTVKDWGGVYRGLLSMYNREVLGKHTVVQHFVFSTLMAATAEEASVIDALNARIPVTAADVRMGPIIAPEEKVICCSDALRLPSALAGKGN
jgi:serine/threonine-protein phosphatase 2A activator